MIPYYPEGSGLFTYVFNARFKLEKSTQKSEEPYLNTYSLSLEYNVNELPNEFYLCPFI